MIALYVVSGKEGIGKTALCAGLGQIWQRAGSKVGYFKPKTSSQGDDLDAAFLRRVLNLDSPLETLAPSVAADGPGALRELSNGLAAASVARDVVLVEGAALGGLSPSQVAGQLGAQVVLLVRYRPGLAAADIVQAAAAYGERLAGVVINFVPIQRLTELRQSLGSQLEKERLSLLGLLPEEPSLLGITLDEMAASLEGVFLTAAQRGEEMVERVTVVPVTVDASPPYFERHPGAALITRGDRPDLQLSALNGPGLCLVLTQTREVNPSVRYRAEEGGMPVLSSALNTATSLERLGEAFSQTRFRQEAKLGALDRLLEEHLDVGALSLALGLQG